MNANLAKKKTMLMTSKVVFNQLIDYTVETNIIHEYEVCFSTYCINQKGINYNTKKVITDINNIRKFYKFLQLTV